MIQKILKKQEIIKLSDREHILKRAQMYIGNVNEEERNIFILNKDETKFLYEPVKVIDGLLKIIFEILDNSIDEGIRTNFKFANKIELDITNNSVRIKDNGRGIPVEKKYGEYLPQLVWCNPRAGSNFNGDRTVIGQNGLGSVLTNVFSNKFKGITSDGKKKIIVDCEKNMEKIDYKISSNKQNYTDVYFEPDFSRFEINEIDDIHIKLVKQRLIFLSIMFPIKFILNGEVIKYNKSHDEFCKMFSEDYYLMKTEDYFIAVLNNEEYDQYISFSLVNGLELYSGSHIDYIESNILQGIKEELSKKRGYDNINLTDIKNNVMLIVFMKEFKNMDFNSQVKDDLKIDKKLLDDYFEEKDLEKVIKKVSKNNNLMDPIKETFSMKKQIKQMREIKKKDKKIKKKEKSTKLIEANSRKRNECELFICEGDSAKTNFRPCRDTKTQAVFPLRGKPLNVLNKPIKDVYKNKEMKDLMNIIGVGLLDMAIEFEDWTDKFYAIETNDNYKCIVNEGDRINLDGTWKKVSKIKKEEVKKIVPYELELKEFSIDKKRIKRKIKKNNMRYGKILFLTDADVDGNAISGLLLAFFSKYYPELFEGEFIYKIKSPLFIVTKSKNEVLRFYTFEEYKKFIEKNKKQYPVKYAKGLGSLSREDYSIILKESHCRIPFEYDTIVDKKAIMKAFKNSKVIERKEWLMN